jgi:hypothetical protein
MHKQKKSPNRGLFCFDKIHSNNEYLKVLYTGCCEYFEFPRALARGW